jgi:hypothetical protein
MNIIIYQNTESVLNYLVDKLEIDNTTIEDIRKEQIYMLDEYIILCDAGTDFNTIYPLADNLQATVQFVINSGNKEYEEYEEENGDFEKEIENTKFQESKEAILRYLENLDKIPTELLGKVVDINNENSTETIEDD